MDKYLIEEELLNEELDEKGLKVEYESEELEDNENELNELEECIIEEVEGMEIGIDLGTCNSSIAYINNGKPTVVKIRNNEIIPSAIFFEDKETVYYGKNALNRGIAYPNSLARTFKRKIADKNSKYQLEFASGKQTREHVSRTYIFDTNVFLDNPLVLEQVSSDDNIILSTTVIEELAYRKRKDTNLEDYAIEAEKQINNRLDTILFDEGNMDLLSEEMFRGHNNNDVNDNKILSLAVKHEDIEPILVTSDKGLQTKASLVNIKTQSLKEFEENKNIDNSVKNEYITMTSEELSTMFLKYLKNEASKSIGSVSKAVICVPANFTPIQIEATKKAGLNAGFKEVKIEKEPIAAAIAYGINESSADKNTILVYDFGGGTFDVSIIECENKSFKVVHYDGDPNLGGEDLTQEFVSDIYNYLEDEFELSMFDLEESELSKEEFTFNKKAIHTACENAKIELSDSTSTSIIFEINTKEGKKQVNKSINRSEFEKIIRDQINTTKKILDATLIGASLKVSDIGTIILAGGTSSIPSISEFLEQYFGKKPVSNRNLATLITEGAIIVANDIWGNDDGIGKKINIFDKTVEDFGVSIKREGIYGQAFDTLIPFDTPLPCTHKKEYLLVKDYQTKLEINLYTRNKNYQNASRTDNEGITNIGKVLISDLPPLQKHECAVDVEFKLTKEYILEVEVAVKDNDGNIIKNNTIRVDKQGN